MGRQKNFTLIFENKEIIVQNSLSKKIPFLALAFKHSADHTVCMRNIDPDIFRFILAYIKFGPPNVYPCLPALLDILAVVDYLQIDSIHLDVSKQLQNYINNTNVFSFTHISRDFNSHVLSNSTCHHIAKNLPFSMNSQEFPKLNYNEVSKIVSTIQPHSKVDHVVLVSALANWVTMLFTLFHKSRRFPGPFYEEDFLLETWLNHKSTTSYHHFLWAKLHPHTSYGKMFK